LLSFIVGSLSYMQLSLGNANSTMFIIIIITAVVVIVVIDGRNTTGFLNRLYTSFNAIAPPHFAICTRCQFQTTSSFVFVLVFRCRNNIALTSSSITTMHTLTVTLIDDFGRSLLTSQRCPKQQHKRSVMVRSAMQQLVSGTTFRLLLPSLRPSQSYCRHLKPISSSSVCRPPFSSLYSSLNCRL